ncbi:protein of unknown function DUF35 [Desulfarculus baarsii DSM 2075]|uniref:DUF35 domain-containing protein n=1 Tax=Desulfarculus baarsii (strain ATCC 33931 / DSM 2075 / LMG 7858 / VKM B-1802 / 2st14) TaxID=644282 RepID=E1QH85_DESB2|nr:Zn-ribbon domain-containing OB-fold protein [Desulfarculus baarsii]ADK84928.1 protein of unknown function DUF35 [Desulfarculus baarsii DSM 2075]
MPTNRLLPTPDADSKPFWDGCREHKLLFQKCASCGHVRWPAGVICPQCHGRDAQWIEARGQGVVYSYAIYHQAFHPAFKDNLPYVVAVVELAEGPMLLGNIVDCPQHDLRCDMAVQAAWDDVTAQCSLPKFRPLGP